MNGIDGDSDGAQTAMHHLLASRLKLYRETIPSAQRRRTARGRVRTCRALGEHLAKVRQLFDLAKNDSERAAVAELIDVVERRRADLAAEGTLAKAAHKERAARKSRRASANACLARLIATIGQDALTDDA